MTDTQVLTIVIAILVSLGALVYNNSRITDVGKRVDDVRTDVGKRIDDLGRRIDDLRDSVNLHIDDKFHLLSQRLKTMEENIMRILGDHETRLHKLENPNQR